MIFLNFNLSLFWVCGGFLLWLYVLLLFLLKVKKKKGKKKKRVTPSIPTTFGRNKGKVDFARD